MTRAPVALCLAWAAACVGEPAGDQAPPEEPRRTDYAVRLDDGRSDPGRLQLEEEDGEVRILTGPAGIAYRPDDRAPAGDFRVSATFVQHSAPVGYQEAYGIFVGGRSLAGAEPEYTYFLIRATGEYLVKRRLGDSTAVVVDWTDADAVQGVDAAGALPRNTLSVEVVGPETRFLVNDVLVHAMPVEEARPHGIAGLRVNHRLDVRVSGWAIEPTGTS